MVAAWLGAALTASPTAVAATAKRSFLNIGGASFVRRLNGSATLSLPPPARITAELGKSLAARSSGRRRLAYRRRRPWSSGGRQRVRGLDGQRAVGVGEHAVAVEDLAREDRAGEGLLQRAPDVALERTGAVGLVEALARQSGDVV